VVNGELRRALTIAEQVPDPELPMLTLADLGVLRGVQIDADGTVTAILTPTYSGCPAMAEMHAAVVRRLSDAGFAHVRTRTQLDPVWSSDWITAQGRRKLAEHGIAPPGEAPRRTSGPVPLVLSPPPPKGAREAGSQAVAKVLCPRCGSPDTEEVSRFGATSCRALWRCRGCLEPFEHFKEI
jgi:ring-1,2-phenylacetyl-CoA epoxidase subunit PaaD